MKKTDVDICHCPSFLFWVYSLDARYTLFYLVVWIDLGDLFADAGFYGGARSQLEWEIK